MRIDSISDSEINVSVRQSWLMSARDCMERSRWSLLADSVSSDVAAIGTAVHAGAESACTNPTATEDDVVAASLEKWDSISADVRWTKYDDVSAKGEVARLARSWNMNLRKHVTSPRYVEQEFSVPFDSFAWGDKTVNVTLTGTVDLVQFDSLWDWKTASKQFSWRDRQSDSIQASVYATAASRLGWLQYPIPFSFGVLIRGTAKSQVVTVHRDARHEEWLKRQVRSLVGVALAVGTDVMWPTNDSGGLCAPQWCDAWANCKGAHLPHVPYPTRSK